MQKIMDTIKYLAGRGRFYKKSVEKIFENMGDSDICIVDLKKQRTKTISKKDFFKILSI
ncbi:MAG: hypothetical protein ACTTIC_03625 [Helicobacteraceae bacterium]